MDDNLKREALENIIDQIYYKAKDDSDLPEVDWLNRPKVPAPDGWEDSLRERLERELPDGCYQFGNEFGNNKIMGYCGKGFKIQLEIALRKEIEGYL